MRKQIIAFILMSFMALVPKLLLAGEIQDKEFLVLCYHSVHLDAQPNDTYGVSQSLFMEQMEYLRTHGYHPISLDDILRAAEGKQALPQKPVLLTFDDGYISYYKFVFPVLRMYGYPSVQAIVGSWIDSPPGDLPEPLMSWDQIRQVAQSDLVEIASQTYDLHKGIQYNPQGNVGPAISVREFRPGDQMYETEQQYRRRLVVDFGKQEILFRAKLGLRPRAVVWPYGRYNEISKSVALEQGYHFCFTLEEGLAKTDQMQSIRRNVIENRPIEDFVRQVTRTNPERPLMRAVQVDLDLIYDPHSYEQTDKNLGKLIDRLVAMKVNTVFLQAFCDLDGTGDIQSVYFHNRVMPVKGDIFSHAVHQMIIRGIKVYAWMPTLSFVLPDIALNESLRVRENEHGKTRVSHSWYRRLTPFSPTVINIVRMLYEDLGAHSQIHGVLFQDDAYLTDKEDFHPLALECYKASFGREISMDDLANDEALALRWARYKTEILIDFTKTLEKGLKRYRPNALFARNLYPVVMTNPHSEKWLAQNYEIFLRNYDEVVVMAYPQMEKIEQPSPWLEDLVGRAEDFPTGSQKTVFKVQTYDWGNEKWVNAGLVLSEMRDILASGGRHLAYYPDDFTRDKPSLEKTRLEMSTCTYPFFQ
jgi:biofilm PGA synthesis lipoprotein PgaB